MSDEPRDTIPDPTGPAGDPEAPTGRRDESADSSSPATGAGSADAANDDSRTDGSRTDVSAPWERPRRWERNGPAANRVDALLARLGEGSDEDQDSGRDPDTRRSRGRNSDGEAVAASTLIAALGQSANDDEAPGPQGASAEDEAGAGDVHRPVDATPDQLPPAPDDVESAVAAAPGAAAADAAAPDAAAAEDAGTEPTAEAEPTAEVLDTDDPQPVPDQNGDAADLAGDAHTDTFPKAGDKAADLAEAGAIRAALDRKAGVGSPTAVAAGAAGAPGTGTRKNAASAAAGPILVHGSNRRRHRGWLYAGRTVAALVAFCTLLGVGVEWKIKDRAEVGLAINAITGVLPTNDPSISTARTTQTVLTNSKGVETTESAPPKTVYQPENILLLGSDTRAGGNATIGGSDESTAGVANSDTLMVAHVSGDREHVTVLSIPRDTIVTTPACRAWSLSTGKPTEASATVHGGTYSHINTLYAVGGPQCTAAGVQSLTGLGITRAIGIDFDGFKAMVDALGGITVNVCRPIQDTVLGYVVAKGGVQVIQGRQAVNLVRARHVIGDTGSDLARIRRQQIVLSAILRQVTQAGTLLNPGKLDGFLQAFVNNTFTLNVKLEDLLTLAGSLGSLDPAHVTFYTLPTVPSTKIDGALDVDRSKATPVFDDLINDLPLPGEVPATTKPKPTATATPPAPTNLKLTVAPSKVALELYDLTGRENAAGTAQSELNAAGFQISDDQLISSGRTQAATVVQFAPANRAAALTVAAALPGSTLLVTPGLGNTVRLQLGSSFAGVVKTVAVGQQAPASLSTAVSTGPSVSTSATTSTTDSTGLSSVNAGAATCA